MKIYHGKRTINGVSLARRETESPMSCKHDANKKAREKMKKKD